MILLASRRVLAEAWIPFEKEADMLAVHLFELVLTIQALTVSPVLVPPDAVAMTERREVQGAAPRDVSSIIAKIREKHDIPGLVAAITTGDTLEAIGASGRRSRDDEAAVTIDDRFHLGSCTKSMTATLIAVLVAEGKLKWTTTVAETFPGLAATMHDQWKGVTLRELLTNRSGAPTNLDEDGLWLRLCLNKGTPREQRMALVEGVVTKIPAAEPGTKYIYSNAGFSIAGAMAESVMDRPWEELITEKVFKPLGMDSVGFGAPGSRERVDEPRGHAESGKVIPPGPGSDNPVAIGPAGIVHASVGDWAKYVRLHLRGDAAACGTECREDRLPRLLSGEQFTTLHRPYKKGENPEYAMGWVVATRPWAMGARLLDTGRVLNHSGSNTLWFCVTWIAPEKDFAVLVCCNQGGTKAAQACDEVASALISEHLGQSVKGK